MALRSILFFSFLAVISKGQRVSEIKCSEYKQLHGCKPSNDTTTVIERFDQHNALLGWSKEANLKSYQFDCAGVIINDRFVLTVAHCIKDRPPVVARLGAVEYDDEHARDYEVEKTIVYPYYNSRRSYHDIALVKLRDRVEFANFIRPACLWANRNFDESSVFAIGTGKLNGTLYRKEIPLNFLNKNECKRQFVTKNAYPRGITEQQMCVGRNKAGNRDSCFHNAGRPIQMKVDSQACTFHVVGLMSDGNACSSGKSAAIYTSVAAYIDWIEKTVW